MEKNNSSHKKHSRHGSRPPKRGVVLRKSSSRAEGIGSSKSPSLRWYSNPVFVILSFVTCVVSWNLWYSSQHASRGVRTTTIYGERQARDTSTDHLRTKNAPDSSLGRQPDDHNQERSVWFLSFPSLVDSLAMSILSGALTSAKYGNYDDDDDEDGDYTLEESNFFTIGQPTCREDYSCLGCPLNFNRTVFQADDSWDCPQKARSKNVLRGKQQYTRKVVYLLRNPFDILVERMNKENLGSDLDTERRQGLDRDDNPERQMDQMMKQSNQKGKTFKQKSLRNNPQGLLEWCKQVDQDYYDRAMAKSGTGMEASLAVLLKRQNKISVSPSLVPSLLPCHTEWYRYVQWHNTLVEVLRESKLPFSILYAEDLQHVLQNAGNDWRMAQQENNSFRELLQSLQRYTIDSTDLQINDIIRWLQDQRQERAFDQFLSTTVVDFTSYFDVETASRVAKFVKDVASPECWSLLHHYFEPWIEKYPGQKVENIVEWKEKESGIDLSNPTEIEEQASGKAAPEDDLVRIDKSNISETIDGEIIEGPRVVWLLSYPNSGTSYTLNNTLTLTGKATATNHGRNPRKLIPVNPLVAKAPYLLVGNNYSIPDLVMTKSHCTGYSFFNRPAPNVKIFREACLRGTHQGDSGLVADLYPPKLVAKAIHLIRNPLDNVLSRMHHALKNGMVPEDQATAMDNSPAGLHAWCDYVDAQFRPFIPKWVSNRKDVIRILTVPCHSDIIRYIVWHNSANQMLQEMDLPVYKLYYENYTTNFDETVQEVLAFVNQTQAREARSFVTGKTYTWMFDSAHFHEILYLIKSFATNETWAMLQHYFDTPPSDPTFNTTLDSIVER